MSELADRLTGINDKLVKAKNEIVGKIDELNKALANAGSIPADAAVILSELENAAQSLDDIVPDITNT